jgi:hypothetical protein
MYGSLVNLHYSNQTIENNQNLISTMNLLKNMCPNRNGISNSYLSDIWSHYTTKNSSLPSSKGKGATCPS